MTAALLLYPEVPYSGLGMKDDLHIILNTVKYVTSTSYKKSFT